MISAEELLLSFPAPLLKSKKIEAVATAIASELSRLFDYTQSANILGHIDTLPESALDTLASDFGVPWWKADAGLDEKRESLRNLWKNFQMLGTRTAINSVVQTYFDAGTVEEWYDYGGTVGHFRIRGASQSSIAENEPAFLRVLNKLKRTSQVFDGYADLFLVDASGNYLVDASGNNLVM